MNAKPTLIIHIGPMKTGTTSLQVALHHSRKALAAHGIAYLTSQHAANVNIAALGLMGSASVADEEWFAWDRSNTDWLSLKSTIRSVSTPQTVISAEAFALCGDQAIAELQQVFSGFDVHLVITLRRISDLVPSYWQENAKRRPYPALNDFVHRIVQQEKGDYISERFWRSHEHDRLIHRWQSILKPAKTTVIIPDKQQPTLLPDAFSSILKIPDELTKTIAAVAATFKNRSRTEEEIAVRQGVFSILEERGLMKASQSFFQRLTHRYEDRTNHPEEHQIRLSASAQTALLPIEQRVVVGLQSLQLHVVGDLRSLAAPRATAGAETIEPQLSNAGLIAVSSVLMAELMTRAGIREGGRVDLGWLSKRATIRHLWSLAIINTAWAILPRRLHQPVRRLIANTRRSK
jgi:hypothetical protein